MLPNNIIIGKPLVDLKLSEFILIGGYKICMIY